MRFDLKTPCKNCPFGKGEERIKFACREHAEEIEESAYRRGFPCHLSADFDEDEDHGGFIFGKNTQHCVGALGMFINGGYTETPGSGNNDDLFERLSQRIDLDASFDSVEAFLDANTEETE